MLLRRSIVFENHNIYKDRKNIQSKRERWVWQSAVLSEIVKLVPLQLSSNLFRSHQNPFTPKCSHFKHVSWNQITLFDIEILSVFHMHNKTEMETKKKQNGTQTLALNKSYLCSSGGAEFHIIDIYKWTEHFENDKTPICFQSICSCSSIP